MEPEFLEPDVVLFLHDQAFRVYGGIQGLRSENLLHSVLGRPMNRLSHDDQESPDLFELAAAYACRLACDHPFNDGNERTGWGCCVLFLKVNGCGVAVPAPEVVERMVLLAWGQSDVAAFALWLRRWRR